MILKKLRCLFFVMILLFSFNSFSFAYVFEKKSQLPPIKMTYEDLNQILTSMKNQLFSSLSVDQQDKVYQYIKISGEDTSLEKEGNFVLSNDDPLPDLSHNLQLNYRSKSGSISRVNLDFGNNERTISIQGESTDAVESMNLLLLNKFDRNKVIIAGTKAKIIIFVFTYIFGGIIIIYSIIKQINLVYKIGFLLFKYNFNNRWLYCST